MQLFFLNQNGSSLISKLSRIRLYEWVCSLLFLFIPLSTAIPNLFLILLAALFLCMIKEINLGNFKQAKFILPLVIVVIFSINSLFHGQFEEDIRLLSRISIFILLIVILSIVENDFRVKMFFITGVNLSILISLISMTFFFLEKGELAFGNTKYVNELLLLERPYFGFLCVLSVIICLSFFKTTKYKYYLLSSAFVCIAFVFVISARMSLVSLCLIGGVDLLYNRRNIPYKKLTILVSILAVVLMVATNKNIRSRFYIDEGIEMTLKKASVYEPRITIWSCFPELMKKKSYNIITGLGSFTATNEYLMECYSYTIDNISKKNYYLSEKFNSHNQLADVLLSHGIVGLGVFISFLILLFYKYGSNYYSIALLTSYLCFLMVENVLHRQLGCYLFGVLMFLLDNRGKGGNQKSMFK